jgi:nucleoside-diphosphate-sugar epimerase
MKILITGAHQRLGGLAGAHFGKAHEVLLTDSKPDNPGDAGELAYSQANLREPDAVKVLCAGVDAILHLAEFDPPEIPGDNAEQERLELSAQGTYVLLKAAREAGVDRVILASTLDLVSDYSEDYLVDENWQPRPDAAADSLGPYLTELVCREFCREGGIRCVCLRFGALEAVDGTRLQDAMEAMEKALVLAMEDPGYRWHLFHISSSPKRPSSAAKRALGLELERGA